jgi:germination protein M
VLFEIEGRPVTVFSSEGLILDGPVGRADYEELLPAIFVDRPAYGAALGNPARIVGSANVFEAQFLITIVAGDGTVVAQTPAMASCGTGCRGTFDVTVPYTVTAAGWGILRVWDGSAKDGSPENVREYSVWLSPAE